MVALWIVYHHYQADYQWATKLDNNKLAVGQVGYWQYDKSIESKLLYETIKRRAQRLSEFAKGPWVDNHRVAQSWSLVIADNTVFFVQTSPSWNIAYGSPMQRFLDAFIEPNPPKYQVQAIRPEQTDWLQAMLLNYPDYAVQGELVLLKLNYPRTTVLVSFPFVIMACGTLVLVTLGLFNVAHNIVANARARKGDKTKTDEQVNLRHLTLVSVLVIAVYLVALQYSLLG